MKVGIMQPYFFPYIGYWQLINAVDTFVIYDNIQYTKSGWIKRNRILNNGKDSVISLTIKKDSDFLNVCDRWLADSYNKDKTKILNQIKSAYVRAPEFKHIFPIIEEIIDYDDLNLFNYLFNSVVLISKYLDIKTRFFISSNIDIEHSLKNKYKVLSICSELGASEYYNAIGGVELYNKDEFLKQGIDLKFLKAKDIEYEQFNNQFVPNLSIIDVLMFNSKEKVQEMLNDFELV